MSPRGFQSTIAVFNIFHILGRTANKSFVKGKIDAVGKEKGDYNASGKTKKKLDSSKKRSWRKEKQNGRGGTATSLFTTREFATAQVNPIRSSL